MNLHKFCSIEGMATKYQSKTNNNKTRKRTRYFIDNDVISENYHFMTDSSKSVTFTWHENVQE